MKPNIFFVTVDSLRAERCFSDNRRATTPNHYSLIKRRINVSQGIGNENETEASMSSVFSVIFPIRTG